MKKYPFYLLILGLLFSQSSCKDDEAPIGTTEDINLSFSAKFNGSDLDSDSPTTTHSFMDNAEIRFTKFGFFVSDVVLYKIGETDETELMEVAYVDLTGENSYSRSLKSIPTGDYSGIKMFIGVGEALNATKPSDYASSDPLGSTTTYWSVWDSYKFCILDGFFDLMDGEGERQFSFHTGSNEMLREVLIPYEFTLTNDNDEPLNLNLEVNVAELLESEDGFWDIENFNATHDPSNPEQFETATFIMDQFEGAISAQ